MAFDWRQYLVLAEDLTQSAGTSPSDEARQRSAVSRAYYAAFGSARAVAERLGFERNVHRPVADHWELPRFLDSHGRPNEAEHLASLRHWRNMCDYDDIVEDLNVVVSQAIRAARSVVDDIV